jgi:DNA-damage-inducible protein J
MRVAPASALANNSHGQVIAIRSTQIDTQYQRSYFAPTIKPRANVRSPGHSMHSNLKTADIRSRVEPHLKSGAASVLAACGLSLSDAIRLFLRQVVAQQGLPFGVKTPNAMTIAAMNEVRAMGKARFATAQELFDDLEKSSAGKARRPTKKQRSLKAV